MALTEQFKKVVDFLTQGLEQDNGDDVFENIADEIGVEYSTDRNLALAPEYTTAPKSDRRNDLKVVSHPSYKGYEVMVIEPRSFGEAAQVVQNLKDKKTIVLNLHLLDQEQSQRTIDFVCGAAHALDGTPQKVGDKVFVFTPSNVTLSVESNVQAQAKFSESLWNRAL